MYLLLRSNAFKKLVVSSLKKEGKSFDIVGLSVWEALYKQNNRSTFLFLFFFSPFFFPSIKR